MKINKAREIAATAWCDKRTSNREMDATLAEVFAELLCKIYRQGRADQNGADVLTVGKLPYELVGDVGSDVRRVTQAAIRAAGPEVEE